MVLTGKFGLLGRQCALAIIASMRTFENDAVVGKLLANGTSVDSLMDLFEELQIDHYSIKIINKNKDGSKKDYCIDVKFKNNKAKLDDKIKISLEDGAMIWTVLD